MVFLIMSVHSNNDRLDVRFPSMIRFSLTAAGRDVMTAETGEGGHDGQLLHHNKAAELAQLC